MASYEALFSHYFVEVSAPCWFKYTFISVPSGGVASSLSVICIIIVERWSPSRVAADSPTMGPTLLFSRFTASDEAVILQSLHCSEWCSLCQHPRKDHPFLHAFTLSDSLVLLFTSTHIIYLLGSLTSLSFFPPSPSCFLPPWLPVVMQLSLSAGLWYWSVDRHVS